MEDESEAAPRHSIVGQLLAPYKVLGKSRDLRILFAGQLVSTFGDWLYNIALIALAYQLTGSATTTALISFVRLLPAVVLLPFAGVLADRFDRKRLMIVADLGRAACMLGLLLVTSRETLWIAYPLTFAASALTSLFRPAMAATLPAVVEDEGNLALTNGLWSQMDALSLVLGPALAGLLIAADQTRAAFPINAATFLMSALALFLVRIPPRQPQASTEEHEGWLSETLAGFRFLFRENDGVLAAFTLSVVGLSLVGGAFFTLTVVLAEDAFGLGTAGMGYLSAAYGAGGVMGGLISGPLLVRLRLGRAFIWGAAASSFIFLFLGFAPVGVLPFVLFFLVAITDVFSEVTGTTVIQTGTPDALLGRVFGAFESAVVLSMLPGALVAGPLIDAVGPRAATIAFAAASAVPFLVSLPRLRRLEDALGMRIFLRGVPVLAGLPHRTLEDLATRVRQERVAGGTEILRQGEAGDRLYILKEGEVAVVGRGDGQGEVELATLGKGDYFGEIALLRDVPRTATVRAQGDAELYSLGRDDFQELLARSEELRGAVAGTSDVRFVETQQRLLLRR